MLERKQARENGAGDRRDVALQVRIEALQTLDGAKHRDGRRDHAVAIEQGGPDQDDEYRRTDLAAQFTGIDFGVAQGEQGENSSFAAVVGSGDVTDVFHADDQQQRPGHQGKDAEHPLGAFARRELRQTLLHRVQRTRADVAKDDAEGPDTKGPLADSLG